MVLGHGLSVVSIRRKRQLEEKNYIQIKENNSAMAQRGGSGQEKSIKRRKHA
jgi:hypothetical protein